MIALCLCEHFLQLTELEVPEHNWPLIFECFSFFKFLKAVELL